MALNSLRGPARAAAPVQVRLFGSLDVQRAGTPVPVPASRKTRAILGYLALAPRPVERTRLCELFFDVPNDPRGAVRWSLTKLRDLLDDDEASRIVAERDTVRFEPRGAWVDVLELRRIGASDLPSLDLDVLEGALALARGPLLSDAELPDRAEYRVWLAAARADCRTLERRIVDALMPRLDERPERLIPLWQRRVDLDPLDEPAYAGLAQTLMRLGRRDEAHATVDAAERALRAEGLRATPQLRAATDAPLRVNVAVPAGAEPGSRAPAEAIARSGRGPSGVPAVAVLPFTDLGAEPLPPYLADGLVEGIVHDLSKFRSLSVLSRMATARFRGLAEDPVRLGQALGVDLLVSGSLVGSAQTVKIRWSVAETRGGRVVASGDVEHGRDDPAGLSTEVATRIAVVIEPHAQFEALERATRKTEAAKVAYDYYLQGLYGAFATLDGLDYVLATRCFRSALEADPSLAAAAAFLPWAAACANLIRTPEDVREYAEIARRAVRGARDDARALAVGGACVTFLTGDIDTGIASVERALHLNPNDHIVWFEAGWIYMTAGEYERPMECFARAEALDPTGIAAVGGRTCRATCCFLHGYLEAAERWARAALNDTADNFWNWVIATAIAAERGDADEARARAARVLAFAPDGLASPLLSTMPYQQASHRARLRNALLRAGVPTEPPPEPTEDAGPLAVLSERERDVLQRLARRQQQGDRARTGPVGAHGEAARRQHSREARLLVPARSFDLAASRRRLIPASARSPRVRVTERALVRLLDAPTTSDGHPEQPDAQQQHRRRFGDQPRLEAATAEAHLPDVLEGGAVDGRERDRRDRLTVDRGDGEEVLAVCVDGEVVLEEPAVDVDAFDVDQCAAASGGVDVEHRAQERIVVREAERQLRERIIARAARDRRLARRIGVQQHAAALGREVHDPVCRPDHARNGEDVGRRIQ
jgi:DNA-binding SARP family transcriptional activator/TolB-like protein